MDMNARGSTNAADESTYDSMTPAEIDAKIAASEARTAEKFAELRGDFNARFAEIVGGIAALRADLSGQIQTLIARVAAVEMRVGAVEARVEGVEKSTAGLRSTVITTGIGAVAIVLATLAIAYQMFGLGLDADAIAEEAATAAADRVIERLQQLPSVEDQN